MNVHLIMVICMKTSISGLLLVGLCYFLVGSSYPIAQAAMNSIPTWIFTCITFLIATVFLVPISIKADHTNWFKLTKKDWFGLSILSLLGAVIYTVLLLYGMSSSSAVTASIITSIAPAMVLILSGFILKEKLTFAKSISIGLAIISVIVMTSPDGSSQQHSTILGITLLMLSTLSNALNIVLSKVLATTIKPLTLATGVCITGTIFSAPMAIHELNHYSISAINGKELVVMLYYGIFVWAIAYICFFKGINKVSAASAGMCAAIVPVASMIISSLFYDYHIKETDVIATIIIILSIMAAEANLKLFTKKETTPKFLSEMNMEE